MTMPVFPTVTPYRTTVIDDDVTGEFFEMLARYDAGGVTLTPAAIGIHPCFWESDGQELNYQFKIRIDWPRAGRPANVSCSSSDNVTFASFRVNGTSYGIEHGKIILPLK